MTDDYRPFRGIRSIDDLRLARASFGGVVLGRAGCCWTEAGEAVGLWKLHRVSSMLGGEGV